MRWPRRPRIRAARARRTASAHRITSYNVCYTKLLRRRATAIAFGCGLSNLTGGTGSVRRFFRRIIGVLSALETPVVLDADGINFLAELQPLALPKNLILTPHERELSRLLRIDVAERNNFV